MFAARHYLAGQCCTGSRRLRAALFVAAGLPVLIGCGMSMLLPSMAAAQCVTVGLDQTCSNAATITGPLNAVGTVVAGVVAGSPGGDGGNAAVSNSGTINPGGASASGGNGGKGDTGLSGGKGGNATLGNSGSIAGNVAVTSGIGGFAGNGYGIAHGGDGADAGNATLSNSGSIAGAVTVIGGYGGFGGDAAGGFNGGNSGNGGNSSLSNSGNIAGTATVTGGNGGGSGGAAGPIPANAGNAGRGGNATLSNSGSIGGGATVTGGRGGYGAGSAYGHGGNGGNGGNATLNNWGSILGGVTVSGGQGGSRGASLVTPGTDGLAGSATLNVFAGSRIVGAIALNGGTRNLNFYGGGNYVYTLNSLAGVNITTTGTPFVVSGNTVAVLDPQLNGGTVLAANARALTDFTRGVSDAVPVFSGSASGGGGAPLAFAGAEPPASSRLDDAFASIPGLASAYAGDALAFAGDALAFAGDAIAFKAPTAVYADGTAVWSRGFAGQRIQQQDGAQPRNTNAFYGGMMGADFAARPDLRYGIFLGGGQTRSRLDLNQFGADSDLLFGGAYARYDIGQSFLHAALQGGSSRTSATTRTINNNLAVNGIETARASFGGWYVSPEATFGHRLALGRLAGAAYTLTPSMRVRYLYGAFDGYTETGTTVPLTIGGQTVSTLEERAELKLTRSVSFTPQDQLSTTIFGGVLGTQRLGGTTVNAALLGQAIPFAVPGKADVWGGFGGLGLEWRTRNVTFFSTAEYLALSDNSTVVSGRAGLRVGF